MTRAGVGVTIQFHGEEYRAIQQAVKENGNKRFREGQRVSSTDIKGHIESLIDDYLERGGFYEDPVNDLPDEINTEDLSNEQREELHELLEQDQ